MSILQSCKKRVHNHIDKILRSRIELCPCLLQLLIVLLPTCLAAIFRVLLETVNCSLLLRNLRLDAETLLEKLLEILIFRLSCLTELIKNACVCTEDRRNDAASMASTSRSMPISIPSLPSRFRISLE